MATTVTKTIKPSGQGGDYTSLSGWEAQNLNLTSLDQIQVASIEGDWSAGADTTAVTIGGWTTDATRYITIQTDAANKADAEWDAAKYVLTTSSVNQALFVNSVSYVSLVGLQISNTRTGANICRAINVYASYCTIDSCYLKISPTSDTTGGNALDAYGVVDLVVKNTITWTTLNAALTTAMAIGGSNSRYIYNCTVYNFATGYNVSSTVVLKNCIANGCTNGYNGTPYVDSTNNCSDITSDAPGTSPQTGTVSFTDAANGNFNLQSGDTVARGNGANLYATFTTDINGNERPSSGAWDIGAAQYVSSGSALAASFTDDLTLGDSFTPVAGFVSSHSDNITTSETVSTTAGFVASYSDGLTISDTFSPVAGFVTSHSDGLTLGDTASSSASFAASFSDNLTTGDSTDNAAAFVSSLSNTVTVGDSITPVAAFISSFADGLVLSESYVATIGGAQALTASFSDGILLGDSIATSIEYGIGAIDIDNVTNATATFSYGNSSATLSYGNSSGDLTYG